MLSKLGLEIGKSFSKLVTEDWHYFSKLVEKLHQLLRKKIPMTCTFNTGRRKKNLFVKFSGYKKGQDFEQSGF
jgi:hypothetical protein